MLDLSIRTISARDSSVCSDSESRSGDPGPGGLAGPLGPEPPWILALASTPQVTGTGLQLVIIRCCRSGLAGSLGGAEQRTATRDPGRSQRPATRDPERPRPGPGRCPGPPGSARSLLRSPLGVKCLGLLRAPGHRRARRVGRPVRAPAPSRSPLHPPL